MDEVWEKDASDFNPQVLQCIIFAQINILPQTHHITAHLGVFSRCFSEYCLSVYQFEIHMKNILKVLQLKNFQVTCEIVSQNILSWKAAYSFSDLSSVFKPFKFCPQVHCPHFYSRASRRLTFLGLMKVLHILQIFMVTRWWTFHWAPPAS